MANQKLMLLTKRIFDKTMADGLGWELTADENTFAVSFPRYSVTIVHVPQTLQMYGTYTLNVFNENGRMLDSIDAHEAQRSDANLQILFERAREIALGVDKAFDELLEEVNGSQRKK